MPHLPRTERKAAPSGWDRGEKKQFYHGTAWKKLRALHLNTSPLCEVCDRPENDMRRRQVDHVIRIEDGGAPLDTRNLMTLCPAHHARKSAMERHGLTLDSTGSEGEKIPAPGTLEYLKKKLA